jgi:hypothetical protein
MLNGQDAVLTRRFTASHERSDLSRRIEGQASATLIHERSKTMPYRSVNPTTGEVMKTYAPPHRSCRIA